MIYSLAPMDGITNSPYRQIVKKIWNKYNKDKNKEFILYTEFITADGFFYNFDTVKKDLFFKKEEKKIICQIFGANVKNLLYAINKIETHFNFDGIDLNIGCPSPKILKNGAGGALMINKEKTLNIIKTLSENSKLPFSIKTRSGIDEKDKEKQLEFIVKASKFCNMISIHARTLKQIHKGEADIDFVLKVKELASPNCKIIFNGGITQDKLNDKNFYSKISKLDGIMIGQAAIGNPWIFVNIIPSWDEKKQVILEHLELNIKFKGEKRGIIEFRKFIGPYIKGIKNATKYRNELMKVEKFKDFQKIINNI